MQHYPISITIIFVASVVKSFFFSRNLRYAAYRCLDRWLNFNKKRKPGRYALPSCIVTAVRKLFPSDVYTGFVPRKSPIFKRKRAFSR